MLVSITSSRQIWFAENRASLQRVRAGLVVAEDERPYLDVVMDSPYEQLAGRGNTVCHLGKFTNKLRGGFTWAVKSRPVDRQTVAIPASSTTRHTKPTVW